ncbi:ankyrin repeat-containing protein BDA1 [Pyrus x bretschneideri]|uniref:ankyrin repeat-containing protein BDA1 n=1 Tax=Pyrus x bretschneideri TaxID=225117 RepID=UPI00051179BF|nr:ankyrin repeat-containing protein BDA1 [Pyrus x bretschneideri]
MDSRLSEASKTGDIQLLHQLMAENPLLLHNLALTSSENPLHVASLAGHVEFVQEILKLKPAFVHEMNQDGFSPMHIAAANGYLEVVRELLIADPRLCRMKGRDQWTPLHYAAARGRGDVVKEMVLACPESLEDVTLYDETSLHLGVNNCQFEAVKTLVESVMELRKDNVLNMKDKNGNSVLHVATWKEQHQVVEWLVGNGKTPSALEVNIVNQSGLTPLDLLLIFPSEAGDREIEEILRGAGASRAQDIQYTPSHGPMETNTLQLQQPNNPMEYFKFKMGRDSPSDARTALLVVAVLVATATFQAGLSPPGGVWQDSTGSNKNGTGSGSNEPAHSAGESIMGSDDNIFFICFVTFNSMGFFVSLYMICVLTTNFPMQLELIMCILAMYGTYNTAVISIAPANPMVCVSLLIYGLQTLLSLVVLLWRLFRIRLRELH